MTTGDAGKGSSVPELPEGVVLPVWSDWCGIVDADCVKGFARSFEDDWVADLINAVYSPGGLKQQLSDLQQRVRELEKELHKLKHPGPATTQTNISTGTNTPTDETSREALTSRHSEKMP